MDTESVAARRNKIIHEFIRNESCGECATMSNHRDFEKYVFLPSNDILPATPILRSFHTRNARNAITTAI